MSISADEVHRRVALRITCIDIPTVAQEQLKVLAIVGCGRLCKKLTRISVASEIILCGRVGAMLQQYRHKFILVISFWINQIMKRCEPLAIHFVDVGAGVD
jgi:hypothetical protein